MHTLIHNNKYIHGQWIVINVLWEIQKKIVGSTPEPSLIKGLIVKLDAKDYTVEESGYCHLAG